MGTPLVRSIRKSPFVIIKAFVVTEFAAVSVYFLLAYFVYFARIWRTTVFLDTLSFETAQALFISLGQVILLFAIFLHWQFEEIRIRPGTLTWSRGLLFRRHTNVLLAQVASVSAEYSVIGRLLRYGTVILQRSGSQNPIILRDIAEPGDVVRDILANQRSTTTTSIPHVTDLAELLAQPEHEGLEFKSSLRWDLRQEKVNKALEWAAMKTVAAFLNSRGGTLVLGVGDNRTPHGVARDIATLQRQDEDGFEVHFSNVFSAAIGPQFRQHVRLAWHSVGDARCCVVTAAPSTAPVYARTPDGQEEFFIRSGNATASLTFSEAAAYIASRFGNTGE